MTGLRLVRLTHAARKHLKQLRTKPSYRKATNLAVLAGRKLVADVAAVASVAAIACTPQTAQLALRLSELQSQSNFDAVGTTETVVYEADEEDLATISGHRTPTGLVAAVRIPRPPSLASLLHASESRGVLLLDGVMDPGNAGSLLRTASALGYGGACLLDACADPFAEKVLRASQGAPFFLPVARSSRDELAVAVRAWRAAAGEHDLKDLNKRNDRGPLVITTQRDAPSLAAERPRLAALASLPRLVTLGSEGSGVSPGLLDALSAAGATVATVGIPQAVDSPVESLNVAAAGAIVMWELGGKQ